MADVIKYENKKLVFWCNGCDKFHHLDPSNVIIKGECDSPTIKLKGGIPALIKVEQPYCMFQIKDGKIKYARTSHHLLAGLTVDMVPLDDINHPSG